MKGRVIGVRQASDADVAGWRDLAVRAVEPNPLYEPACVIPAARHQTFGHEIVYSSAEWIDLARTHSDHHTLPPAQLAALLAEVRTEVDLVGGQVPVQYEATLVTGRRL